MFHVVLYQPEIPPNTGNIIRLCAATGASLHLIEPMGFRLDDRRLRRAGLDYHELAVIKRHPDWKSFLEEFAGGRLFGFTTRGKRLHSQCAFTPGDGLVFGPESRGLPDTVLDHLDPDRWVRLPMLAERRSLNLASAASVALYEAWRQAGFEGASDHA